MAVKSISLRLEKLPDRTPVKLRVSLTPDLHRDLSEYAAAYAETYDVTETVAALIPSMLEAFMNSDTGFKRFQKHNTTSAVTTVEESLSGGMPARLQEKD